MSDIYTTPAYINSIVEEGTKGDAVFYLIKADKENILLRAEIECLTAEYENRCKALNDTFRQLIDAKKEIKRLEDALILVCEDEGYLMHGPEGMSDEQQQVYDAILPALERREALKKKSDE